MKPIGKLAYAALRVIHFLMLSASLPAAFFYVRAQGTQSLPTYLQWFAFGGAMIWALIYLGLHSYSFPGNIKQAVFITVAPFLNLIGSTVVSSALLSGAFMIVYVPLVAHLIFLIGVLIAMAIPRMRKQFLKQDIEWWMIILIGVLILLLLVFCWILTGPLLAKRPELNGFALLAIVGIVAHLFSELRILYDGSIFSDNSQDEDRTKIHDSWAGFTAICLIASLASLAVVMLWMQ